MKKQYLFVALSCLLLVIMIVTMACAKETPSTSSPPATTSKPATSAPVTSSAPASSSPATTSKPATSAAPTSSAAVIKPVELKFTHYASAQEFTYLLVLEMEKRITQRTNGAVTFKNYNSGQLGTAQEILPLTQDGTVDIGGFGEGYYPGQFPLTGIAVMPYTGAFGDIKALAFEQMVKEFPEINNEFTSKGLKLMIPGMSYDPLLVMRNKKIQTMADLKGLKIRTGGGDASLVSAWGGTPVGMVYADIYDALAKGTIDGSFSMPIWSYTPVGMEQIAKYFVDARTGVTFSLYIAMNQKKYASLQPELQKIIDEESAYATEVLWPTVAMDIVRKSMAKAAAVAGNEFYALPEDVIKQMKEASMTTVHNAWIDSVVKAGAVNKDKATAILNRWIQLNEQNASKTKLMSFVDVYNKEIKK